MSQAGRALWTVGISAKFSAGGGDEVSHSSVKPSQGSPPAVAGLRKVSHRLIKKIKIDRAFVSSILDDRPSEHIIKAILALCDGLEMDVVAEGIETEAQADKLIKFGCRGGQGYLFGKPVDADATLAYLRDAACVARRAFAR